MKRTEIVNVIRKRAFGLAFTIGAASFVMAQQKVSISGSVKDANGAVGYSSITFKNTQNAQWSDAALADAEGKFKLELVPGTYEVSIDAIDYKKFSQTIKIEKAGSIAPFVIVSSGKANLDNTTDIQGVVITAPSTKPYKVELDKKTYDPSQDIVSKGGNLQDVLSNVPSVSVDTDGTVSMRGNSNIRFLINGKPSSLLGIDDGADALKSIPADQIEKIEVITNPSSKFEASGTAGILNIILKKSSKMGFNGSVEGTLGYLPNTRLNTSLSWKKGAWTYYINGGGSYNRNKSKNNSTYNYILDPSTLADNASLYTDQRGETKSESKNYNVNSGFVVDLTEKSSLNASVMFRSFENEGTETIKTEDRIINQNTADPNLPAYTFLDKNSLRINESLRDNNSFQADLGFDQKIGDKGQLLSLATSYQTNKTNSSGVIDQTSFTSDGSSQATINNTLNDSKNTTFLAKADYELPIGEASKLEAGARYDSNNNDYSYFVNQSIDGSPLETLDRFTSDTRYDEKISAAYSQFRSKIGNLGYQLGLRAENTNVDVSFKSLETAELVEVSKNYTGLFPSVFLSYNLDKSNQILLNYSRRINRPRSWFLIPFTSFGNDRSLFLGNPDLNPTYENSFELGYSLSKSKIVFNPTLYFKKSQDEVNFYQYNGLDSQGSTVLYRMPVNAGSETNYGLDLNATYDPFKWWRIMGNIDLYGYSNSGSYNEFSYDGEGFSSRIRLTSTFRPDKKTSFQIQGFYRGPETTASMDRDAMYAINFGATRTVLKGDGTLAFNIQDIFNTRARESTTLAPSYEQYQYMQWSPRQFSISFTYRFKQGEKIELQKKKIDINANAPGGEDMPPM
ncbi:TonB-dependent receptor domain-containing protein [Chryseobacterium sp. SC28]|uniref:TonB-dependent receptor domain-containing protein n=1 Tax=Chryseobacterium sp. SC28 TaxID=2268028 RepID=UPI000F653D31|nr:TonB-dependent receptor [Chryseobacterium sp. SC28]RRQ45434.1 TonB-dependent receptor [Chryseobacterium sp. SC28]